MFCKTCEQCQLDCKQRLDVVSCLKYVPKATRATTGRLSKEHGETITCKECGAYFKNINQKCPRCGTIQEIR